MMQERLPEKRIFPGYEDEKVTERKYKGILDVLSGTLDEVDTENRPTIMDFQGLNPEASEEDFLKWMRRELGIDPELILEDGGSPESKTQFELLNYAYQQAKDFLSNTLKYDMKELSKNPQSLNSKRDIFDLLSKTRLVRGQTGLSQAVIYCRLVKATVATYETLKNDALLLSDITREFENKLVSNHPLKKDTPLVSLGENGEGGFYARESSNVKGTLATRGKKFRSTVLRFINRPEASAGVALKDGIASRITIEPKQGVDLMPVLYKWLAFNMGVSFINIENDNFFSQDEIKRVEKKMLKALSPKKFSFSSQKGNAATMGKFVALKITGIVATHGLAENNKLNPSKHARQFEIQLVPPNNKNEEGKMNHYIYDVVKLVSARTRLDGGCGENAFNQFVLDATEASGISAEKIKHYLLEADGAPIVKIKKKNGGGVYVAHSVYARWNGFGWVDSELFEEIDASKM